MTKLLTVTNLLNGTHADYLGQYATFRDQLMETAVLETLAYFKETPFNELTGQDHQTLYSAEVTLGWINYAQSLEKAGADAKLIKNFKGTKQFGDVFKWCLSGGRQCISQGTLEKAWAGFNLNGKAKEVFANHDAKYGQSKVAVTEHPYPSKHLKSGMFSKFFKTKESLMKYAFRRNFICYTSAPEDNTLTKTELPWKAFFSRYDQAGVKAFVLNSDWATGEDAAKVMSKLMKSVATAKTNGFTFEEWVTTIIEA